MEQPESLDAAVASYRSWAEGQPPGTRTRAEAFDRYGAWLLQTYAQTSVIGLLDEAVRAFEQATRELPAGAVEQVVYASNLASAHHTRYGAGNDEQDLHASIAAARRALKLAELHRSPHQSQILVNLGTALRDLALRQRSTALVDEAVRVLGRAVDATRSRGPERAYRLTNLAIALRTRYVLAGDPADLDTAIGLQQTSLRRVPKESTERPWVLSSLASLLVDRYERQRRTRDLRRAAAYWRAAAEATSPGSPEFAIRVNNVAVGEQLVYRYDGDPSHLDRALEALDRVAELLPERSPRWPELLNNLGNTYLERHARTGDPGDLDRAVEHLRGGLELAAPSSVDAARLNGNLGNALRQCYERAGRQPDLDDAIGALRDSVRQTAELSPDLPGRLNGLALCLHARFQRLGRLDDLDEAVAAGKRAVAALSSDAVERAAVLTNLGIALLARARMRATPDELEEAIACIREAIARTPQRSPALGMRLNNLAHALLARYGRGRDGADLAEAVRALRRAVRRLGQAPAGASGPLANLAIALYLRSNQAGRPRDLDEAVATFSTVLGSLPAEAPDRSIVLVSLGQTLRARHLARGSDGDHAAGVAALRDACRLGLQGNVEAAVEAARMLGGWMADEGAWTEAAQAYLPAVRALRELFPLQARRADSEAWLATAPEVAVAAAFALSRTGDAEAAVTVLEQGRTMFFAEAFELVGADLQGLRRAGHPDLVDQFEQARDVYRWALTDPNAGPQALGQARRRVHAAVAAIRRVPGFGEFLPQPSWTDIHRAAAGTVLVYVLATAHGGCAILVRADQRPRIVPLPDLGAAVDDRTAAYLDAHRRRLSDPADWTRSIDLLTAWLWEAAMGPVMEHLADAPQVTLVPTGRLALLPLHAAWRPVDSEPYAVLDQVTCSYAPSFRAAGRPRLPVVFDSQGKTVVVADPQPSTRPPLPAAVAEAHAVAAWFPGRIELLGERATVAEVQQAIEEATLVHLCCHGTVDLDRPLDSGLVLARDQLLTLRHAQGARLDKVALAVLSACDVAAPGTRLPDEVVSLPTGFLQAGVRAVVASFWDVLDDSTALLMERLYEELRQHPGDVAGSLRVAQRWLRSLTWSELARRRPEDATAAQLARLLPNGRPYRSPEVWGAFAAFG